MNTKEAIEFLKNTIYWNFGDEAPIGKVKYLHCVNDIIKLLQRGEKYEAMWGELSKRYGNYFYTFDVRIANDIEYKYVDEIMDIIKQKYFPKEELSVHKS